MRGLPAYGRGPLHALGVLACLALAAYTALHVATGPGAVRIAVWFAGAVVLHDLVLFPLYTGLDRALPARGRNHVRVPAALSLLLLLVYWPAITRQDASYRYASGLDEHPFLAHYLIVVAVLFALSGVHWALRGRRT